MLDEIDFLQSPRIQALKEQALSTQSESEKRRFLAMLVREILSALNNVTVSKIEDGVNVNNLDEIQASFRNELARANKPITALLKQLNLTTQEQTKVMSELDEKGEKGFNEQFQTVVVKRLKDIVTVDNLGEVPVPTEIKVNNLAEVCVYLQSLIDKIEALDLSVNVEAPQVTVQPTPVNIPETKIPELDLSPIVDELRNQLKKLSANNKSNPLAVRLTDGANWIKEFKAIADRQEKAITQYMSDVAYIKNAAGMTVNPATAEGQSAPTTIGNGTKVVASAGTAEALGGSVVCRKITMTALDTNTGKIYWGGATVSATSGAYIYAGQTQVIDIDNLSKVYIDSGVNGEGVNYSYVA